MFREDFIIARTWRPWAQCERKALGAKGTALHTKAAQRRFAFMEKWKGRSVKEAGSVTPERQEELQKLWHEA